MWVVSLEDYHNNAKISVIDRLCQTEVFVVEPHTKDGKKYAITVPIFFNSGCPRCPNQSLHPEVGHELHVFQSTGGKYYGTTGPEFGPREAPVKNPVPQFSYQDGSCFLITVDSARR
jgi:hypothetical protein